MAIRAPRPHLALWASLENIATLERYRFIRPSRIKVKLIAFELREQHKLVLWVCVFCEHDHVPSQQR